MSATAHCIPFLMLRRKGAALAFAKREGRRGGAGRRRLVTDAECEINAVSRLCTGWCFGTQRQACRCRRGRSSCKTSLDRSQQQQLRFLSAVEQLWRHKWFPPAVAWVREADTEACLGRTFSTWVLLTRILLMQLDALWIRQMQERLAEQCLSLLLGGGGEEQQKEEPKSSKAVMRHGSDASTSRL